MLLVLEAGLDVDLDMLKLIGLRGIAIALTGSLLPLGLHSMFIWWSYAVPRLRFTTTHMLPLQSLVSPFDSSGQPIVGLRWAQEGKAFDRRRRRV